MVSIVDKNMCCGCEACAQICPKQCITMIRDEEGFLYPQVDQDKCISCKLCEQRCPVLNVNQINQAAEDSWYTCGGYHKNEAIRQDSSSGGAFSLFALHVLRQYGVVFGCTLDENLHAKHIYVEREEDLTLLRGSKYVQSEIGNTYAEVKSFLAAGRKVLFVGTSCQVAGLYSFLGYKVHDNLYTIDFICHGVPSPMIFEEYIASQEEKNHSKIVMHKFRNKDKGWHQSGLQLGTLSAYENGKMERRYPSFSDKYMNGFLGDIYLRSSCYDCKFKTMPKSYADFTIADFWGVDKVNPDLNDGKGTSLLLIHTQRGKDLFDAVSADFYYEEVPYESAIKRNGPLIKSSKKNPNREKFYEDYHQKGYKYVEKKYLSAFTWILQKSLKILGKTGQQFFKFGLVGASSTVINLATYYICIYLGMHYNLAYTMGFLISVCNAFFWNNKYVFRDKQETSLLRAFLKVFTSYGFSFLLSIVIITLLVEILSIPPVVAPILKMVVTIPINFVLNKLWAFKDK